jgi:hypothetical protein
MSFKFLVILMKKLLKLSLFLHPFYFCNYNKRRITNVCVYVVCRLPALMLRFDELRAAGDLLPSAFVVDGEYHSLHDFVCLLIK